MLGAGRATRCDRDGLRRSRRAEAPVAPSSCELTLMLSMKPAGWGPLSQPGLDVGRRDRVQEAGDSPSCGQRAPHHLASVSGVAFLPGAPLCVKAHRNSVFV